MDPFDFFKSWREAVITTMMGAIALGSIIGLATLGRILTGGWEFMGLAIMGFVALFAFAFVSAIIGALVRWLFHWQKTKRQK